LLFIFGMERSAGIHKADRIVHGFHGAGRIPGPLFPGPDEGFQAILDSAVARGQVIQRAINRG
jgi:hypothetical protein